MLMKRLDHPNIIMLLGVASNEEPVMIVMEFAPGGSVLDAVQSKPGPSMYNRINKYLFVSIFLITTSSIFFVLLSLQIIHRDVAARNCLIGKNDIAKISDFGLSIVGTQKKEKTLRKVPIRYLAPETLKKREYSVKTDVWSFGVFLWEVFHDGKEPYEEMSAKEVRAYVLTGHTLQNESNHYPSHMWSITVSCFARNPNHRPEFNAMAQQILAGIEEYKEHKSLLSSLKFW
ncbi:protein tyrosine kinase [Oesophagostomum dentatum]|uniref:Protein tyrosine kinase n=1 Tax=Oesophagostomum dentatum TaxID=61180 RepID=A0A0B1TKX7_OESDE|nr:protein tyrosine kinase [Oesophagostomum dentatum]